MATKGNDAKNNVAEKLKDLYGPDYVGIFDKKIIVNEHENGETVQIAITLTCPKTTYGVDVDDAEGGNAQPFEPAEITPTETENIKKLMAQLGL